MSTQPTTPSPAILVGFTDLSPEARDALIARGRERRWVRGETVYSRFHPPAAVYSMTEGLAAMVAHTPNGYRRILSLFKPGDLAGARTLMPELPEADHGIVAITPVAALEISRRDLEEVGEDHPEVLIQVTRSFSQQIQDLGQRLMGVMSVEVRVRLARLLLDLSIAGTEADDEVVELSWDLTHREMAEIVGASRPHVSSVLGELEEEGSVERMGQEALRVRPARLQEIVSES
ncbi:MAG: Crp/Fnr family transcriptional regulator [Gemmatimonadota bacterium]|nr:Crp/Fnr family transcriptional regulator [Gemmatimonadota bacterium]